MKVKVEFLHFTKEEMQQLDLAIKKVQQRFRLKSAERLQRLVEYNGLKRQKTAEK